jgi:hypothetical protein
MKKTLQKMLAAAVLACGFAFGQTAQASHYQGSDLTYAFVGPNTYQVTFTVYRDCSGISLDSQYGLSIQCVNGGSSRYVQMLPTGSPTNGAPYCPSLAAGNACTGSSSQNPNYQTNTYQAMVTFTAAEIACSGGMVRLSTSNNARPATRNLDGMDNLYSEATINLTAGINNSSPQLINLPVPYINVNKPIMYSAGALDLDGDSLVYSLQPALAGLNTVMTYNTGFTYLNPITANPALALNSQNGSITLTPTVLTPGPASAGYNKYVVVVQIDEYRKINGAVVKVGSVRRDIFITVIDCGPNQNPLISNITTGSQSLNANDVLNVKPGQPVNIQFAATDLDANSVLELTSDVTAVLPGATVNITSGTNPTGTISFTPTASHIRSAPYYFNLNVKDNACPVKGYQMKTIGLRVSQNGGVNGTKNDIESINSFVAYPNPAKAAVSFKINLKKETSLESIVIYNSLGQEVERLAVKALTIGENKITWPNAPKHAAGTYTAQLISSGKTSQTIQFSKLQ